MQLSTNRAPRGIPTNRQATLAKQAPTRSTKLLDHLIFKDSEDMSFSNWLSRIKNKLRENADYYPTKSMKLAYVKGLIGGEAAKNISLQLRDDAIDLYITI